MYYLLIIERLNGVALFESNNNNFKNLNRIKNRKEKRLKGEKKKEDIFPIGRINIGAIEKKKKFEPSSIQEMYLMMKFEITISPSSCHRFLSRHYLYPAEIGNDETNFHHNDGIFNDVKSKNFSFSIFITFRLMIAK